MDTDGHQHPGPEHDTDMAILAIETDEDITGYCFGSPQTIDETKRKRLESIPKF